MPHEDYSVTGCSRIGTSKRSLSDVEVIDALLAELSFAKRTRGHGIKFAEMTVDKYKLFKQ